MIAKKASKKPSKENSEAEKQNEKLSLDDIEKIVITLGKEGNSPAKIGLVLKEKHGISNIKLLGKKISKILKEANIKYKTDFDSVAEKLVRIEKHFAKNKQDKRAKRDIVKYVSRKKRLNLYHSIKN